jgi:uncharacterized protein YkwD
VTRHTQLTDGFREVGSTPVRSLEPSGAVYAGRLGGNNPLDVIRLRVSRWSRVALNVSELTASVKMQWLDCKGKALGRSRFLSTQNSTAPTPTLKPGTYYLKLSARSGVSAYRLRVAIAPQPSLAQKSLRSFSSRSFSDNQGDRFALKVLRLTNDYRRSFGLAPLRLNPVLSAIAQAHSQDMASNDFFDHVGSSGSTLFDRFSQSGYAYRSGGENIAAGFTTPKTVVNAWINSPGHRANLLTPFFQEMGVGFVHLPSDPGKIKLRYYWTQDFGVPAN